jgi:hypothetical protein
MKTLFSDQAHGVLLVWTKKVPITERARPMGHCINNESLLLFQHNRH